MRLRNSKIAENWAMGGKAYIKKDVFELWISGLPQETIHLPIPGQQKPERLNLRNPFTKIVGGIRIIFHDRVLRLQGLSAVQMEMLAKTMLHLLGYSDDDIDSSNVVFLRPFRIYPVSRKRKDLLTGHRADDQYKLALKSGPVVRLRRITSRVFVLEVHGLTTYVDHHFFDGHALKQTFQVQRTAHYKVRGGSMYVINKLVAIPFLGFNNAKRFLEHFSTANNMKYVTMKRPDEGKSNIYSL